MGVEVTLGLHDKDPVLGGHLGADNDTFADCSYFLASSYLNNGRSHVEMPPL